MVTISTLLGENIPILKHTPIDNAVQFVYEETLLIDKARAYALSHVTTEGVFKTIYDKIAHAASVIWEKIKGAIKWCINKLRQLQLWFAKKLYKNQYPTYLDCNRYYEFMNKSTDFLEPTIETAIAATTFVEQNPNNDDCWKRSQQALEVGFTHASEWALFITGNIGEFFSPDPKYSIKNKTEINNCLSFTRMSFGMLINNGDNMLNCKFIMSKHVIPKMDEEILKKYSVVINEHTALINFILNKCIVPETKVVNAVIKELLRAISGKVREPGDIDVFDNKHLVTGAKEAQKYREKYYAYRNDTTAELDKLYKDQKYIDSSEKNKFNMKLDLIEKQMNNHFGDWK